LYEWSNVTIAIFKDSRIYENTPLKTLLIYLNQCFPTILSNKNVCGTKKKLAEPFGKIFDQNYLAIYENVVS
jgi:hypothetical protein